VVAALRLVVIVVQFSIAIPVLAHAAETRRLITDAYLVSIETLPDHQYGSGIVLGFDDHYFYVLTAGHLFPSTGDKFTEPNAQVTFYWQQGLLDVRRRRGLPTSGSQVEVGAPLLGFGIPASAITAMREALPWGLRAPDFGVVVIPMSKEVWTMFFDAEFAIIGDADLLFTGDPVTVFGNPRGDGMYSSPTPAKVSSVEDADEIVFDARELRPGYSGGILVDSNKRPVGLITSSAPPVGHAIRLDRIVTFVLNTKFTIGHGSPSWKKRLSVDKGSYNGVQRLSFGVPLASDAAALAVLGVHDERGKGPDVEIARVDLNGDGTPEILAQVQDMGQCGSAGCHWVHQEIARGPNGFRLGRQTPDCGSVIWIDRRKKSKLRMLCFGMRDYDSMVVGARLPAWGTELTLRTAVMPAASKPAAPKGTVATPTERRIRIGKSSIGYVNVRQLPSRSSPSVARVHPGESYTVSDVRNGWYRIDAKSKSGWIAARYVIPLDSLR
jgi:hypothetical protein